MPQLASDKMVTESSTSTSTSTNTDLNGNTQPDQPSDQNGNYPPATEEANGGGGAREDVVSEEAENTYTKLDVCFLCAQPATFTCDKSGLVAFCSEKHQKLHRFAAL